MSDTPRTDAALAIGAIPFEEQQVTVMDYVVPADFARQLERELAEARKDAERLEWLMSRHRSSLYRMVTSETYHGVLAGTDEYRTRMRAAIDAAIENTSSPQGKG